MPLRHAFFLFLIYLCIFYVHGKDSIGDECHNTNKNLAGQCTLLNNCPSAIEGIRNNIHPQLCGYEGLVPIVCCPITHKPGSVAEQKCWEYSESVYKIMPSPNVILSQKPLNMSTCILTTKSFSFGNNCVQALDKEFPHMAVLGYGRANNKQWKCAGTLISDRFILTAAHCTNSREHGDVKFIRLGELNIEASNDGGPQDFYVTEIILHPNYLPPSKYNDIALLKMDRPTKFNEFIRPACLHLTKNIPGRYIVTGWDQIDIDDEIGSGRLQKIALNSFPQEECNSIYTPDKNLSYGINFDSQFCAGNKNDQTVICQLDTGGPLQIYHPEAHCMYSIIGVNSFGRSIPVSSIPNVYSRVSNYVQWIEQNVWL